MKKQITLVLTAFAALFTQTNVNAQSHDASLNLAPIAFSNFSGAYYYNYEDNLSFGGTVGFQNFKIDGLGEEIAYSGFYLAPEVRYFFNPDNDNDGFFAGGYLKFRSAGTNGEPYSYIDNNGDVKGYDQRNTGLSLGITSGRTWVTDFGVFFSVWSGIGYFLFDNVSYTNDYDPATDSFLGEVTSNLPSLDFRLGLSVGYRFE